MRRVLPSVVAVLLWCAPASAQVRLPTLIGQWNPVAGSGAVYDVTGSDGSHSTMDLSVVKTEGSAHWLEIATRTGADDIVVKELLSDKDQAVQQVIAKVSGKPPVEVPAEALVGGGIVNVKKGRFVSKESLTVAGVRYDCQRFRITDGSGTTWDVYTSAQVPPCNLVRLRSATLTITLSKVYRDAHTRVTESPQPLELP